MRSHHAFLIFAVSYFVSSGCTQEPPKIAPTKPPVVLVSTPVTDEITEFEDFTGRTDAVFSVEVRARVTGYLEKVNFKDGAEVKEGDLLFEIDPRIYQAELDRAEATVLQAEARVKRLEADNRRANLLFNRGAISREEFERISSDFAEGNASVGIAKANRDLAKLNVGYTKVTAPISGRISRRLVDPGNLVQADSTALTTIVSLDPMYVYFDIDERTMLRFRRLIREGKIQSRESGAVVPIQAALSDEEGFPHEGTINFSDNRVDASTGTLRVRGSIDNHVPRVLSPGLFMRVRVPIGTPHYALMIAEQSLGTDQGRKFLYVVNDKNEVVYRPVKVGPLNEGLRVIEDGLKRGEKVIVSGLQRVKPGAKVEPKPAEAAKDKGTDSAKGGESKKDGAPKEEPKKKGSGVAGKPGADRAGEPSAKAVHPLG
ncbi:efflux RND transporter periplasmic adaptor subunit [Singulisphaera sp. PoT]|uniref:efflux RND transporter periplasmic adaptor subunit n=1 Tax=Singulisphaera sp. PoT TaxID=3411797 RepID=UPI003BF600AA